MLIERSHSSEPIHHNMYKTKINPKRQNDRWEFLATRNVRHRRNCDDEKMSRKTQDDPSNGDVDKESSSKFAFDCSDLVELRNQMDLTYLVSQDMSKAMKKWRSLNERKVVPEVDEEKKKGWGIHRRAEYEPDRISLPYKFDYKSELDAPPKFSDEEMSDRDKVIDVMQPGKMLDYESELWKIFKGVRKLEDFQDIINDRIAQASGVDGVSAKTLKVKEDIDKLHKIQTIDVYAMSRLRVKDCHHFPVSGSAEIGNNRYNYKIWENGVEKNKISNVSSVKKEFPAFASNTCIRMEFLKDQYTRGTQVENSRLEVDFLGSHTLLDVHNAIVERLEDPVLDNASGMFFMENVFYTVGDEDYSKFIIEWINEYNCKGINPPRRDALGISSVRLTMQPMSSMKLGQLSFRLCTRYVHICQGDIQTNVFFTCTRSMMKNEIVPVKLYPLILDEWTKYSQQDCACQACDNAVAVCICFDDDLTNGDPTLFCPRCYYLLHYDKNGKLLYNNFRVYPLELFMEKTSLSNIPKGDWFYHNPS